MVENERKWSAKSGFYLSPLGHTCVPTWVCAPVPAPASVRTGGNPRTKIAVPNLRMRPNFRSWLRYNRATSATTFSPRKSVPSYGPAPTHSPLCAFFRHSPDTKSPRMRPTFRSWLRYDRATNATTFRYKKLHHSYDFGRISYESAASRPHFPSYEVPPSATRLS